MIRESLLPLEVGFAGALMMNAGFSTIGCEGPFSLRGLRGTLVETALTELTRGFPRAFVWGSHDDDAEGLIIQDRDPTDG